MKIFFLSVSIFITSHSALASANCANVSEAILAFRQGCGNATSLGFSTTQANRKKWCDCLENNYHVERFVEKDCAMPLVPVYRNFWNNSATKVKCGTPSDPQ